MTASVPEIQPGPRILKEVGSADWCRQTIGMLKRYMANIDRAWREAGDVLAELEAAGGHKLLGYRSFDAMCLDVVGQRARTIRRNIKAEEIKALGKNGAHSSSLDIIKGGTDPTYIVARLKRDRPDLADRVIAGEISPNAAAIEAGFRHPMINVRADDPVAAVRALLRRYTAQEIQQAIEQTR